MKIRARLFLFLLLLLAAVGAFAQGLPTATVSGRVAATDGSALPGVTVTVTSPNLQGSRSTVTTATGDYILALLPPGMYTVTFELSGMSTVKRRAQLGAGMTETLDVELGPAAISEAITVTADIPVTAVLESTTVGTNISQDLLEQLPTGRTITAATLLAPGVNDNGPGGNITISGAMSFENLFLIDGVVVNENLRGQPQALYIEDAVQETTVLTGSISAEYGRFTGGVVNTITKSGGNAFDGSFRTNLTSESWSATTPVNEARGDDIGETYEATFGGPLWRDRLWFFTAGRHQKSSDTAQTIQSSLPAFVRTGDQNVTPVTYPHSFRQRRLEGKLSGAITQKHNVVVGYTDVNDVEQNNRFTASIYDIDSLAPERLTPNTLFSAHYSGTITNNFFLEGQFSRREFAFIGSGTQFTDLLRGTLVLDRGRGGRYNSATFRRTGPEERDNESYLVKGTYFVSTPSFGTHDIRVGYEDFNEVRKVDNYQSGSDFRLSVAQVIFRGTEVFPIVTRGSATRIIYTPLVESSRGSNYKTKSLFVNDSVKWGNHFTFNLGARYDKNDATDGRGATVADDSAVSPRLAAHYDVQGDGRFIVNASYGQYVAKLAEGAANDADPAGRTASFQWNYPNTCPQFNTTVTAPTSSLTPTREVIAAVFACFNQLGGITMRPFRTAPSVPGVDSRIGDSLTSPNVKEYTLGFGTRLGPAGYARVDLVRRNWDDFYTDILNRDTGKVSDEFGQQYDLTLIGTSNSYDRNYDALQTQFRYQLPWKINVGANYTWSRLTGNLTGETSGDGPVTGSADSYPEYRRADWNTPEGYLGADQRHRLRFWAGYDFTMSRFGAFNVTVLQSYDSGTAYSDDGAVDTRPFVTNPGYLTAPATVTYYFGPRGARRTDDIARTDLAINYSLPLPGGMEFFVQPELLNMFNRQGAESVFDSILTYEDDPVRFQRFNPFTETPVYERHWAYDENHGHPNSAGDYQTPRTFRISLGLRF